MIRGIKSEGRRLRHGTTVRKEVGVECGYSWYSIVGSKKTAAQDETTFLNIINNMVSSEVDEADVSDEENGDRQMFDDS